MTFPKRLGSDFQIAMVEATDPINPVNPFFHSFGSFWVKIRKIHKPIKIPLIFIIFPLRDDDHDDPRLSEPI